MTFSLRDPGRLLIVVASSLAVAASAAGCASVVQSAAGIPDDRWSVMSAEQQAALEDGVVTEQEYTAGYDEYVSCLAQAGFEIEEQGRPGGTYRFGIPEEAVDAGVDESCYLSHFDEVDSVWQGEHPQDDEGVKVILRQCLEAEGLGTEGTETELSERIDASAMGFIGCMEEFG